MKLTAILLLAACLQVAARTEGQTVTLKVKNAPMKEVFREIQKQTGLNVMVDEAILEKVGRVTLDVRDMPVPQVLNICLKNEPLTYTIIDGRIVVKPIPTPALQSGDTPPIVTVIPPPPIDVHGRVVNEKGESVAGASVQVKGSTTKGTSTDADGYFTLKGVDENATLVISAVNIEEYTIKVSGKTDLATLNVKTRVVTGEEIRVNTGYQILKPNEVTGSVVVITKEQLDQRVSPDIISKLEGITNGLVFNKRIDGTNALRIRGESTLFGYTEPLIVLDNFPYDGDINNINPNDIENITILKDAAAASIWGVQAGNGVIVITTKKGKLNSPLKVELNTNFTITDKPDLFYSPRMTPSDFIDFEILLFNKGKYLADLSDINKRAVSPIVEILNNRQLGLISATDSAAQVDALRSNDLRKEALKNIYQKAIHQQYQINLSGGSNKMSYYFSAGFDKGLSNLAENSDNRITINARNNYTPVKNLHLFANIIYTEASSTNNGNASIPNIYPYMLLKDASGNDIAIPQHRKRFEDTISNHGFFDWKYYPLQEMNNRNFLTKTYDTRLTAGLNYDIMMGLTVEATYQYERSLTKNSNLTRQSSYSIRNSLNSFAILNASGNYISTNYPLGGELNIGLNNLVGHYGRLNLKYNRQWGNNGISGIIGFEAREISTENTGSKYYGYNEDNGSFSSPNLFVQYSQYPSGASYIGGSSGNTGLSYSGTLNRFRSYFSNVAYTFRDRYIVSASARFDGSNYFGVKTNNKTVPLWSTGVKWQISKEKFYNTEKLPNLSLRMTYGYNGNLATNIAALTTILYSPNPAPFTGQPEALINNIPNPELRWEKISQLNVGLDFSTKNSKVTGSVEYFHKKGDDLIGSSPIDPTTGVTQLTGNFSGMKSKGFDVFLSSKNIDKKFKWQTSFIFNYAAETVTRYDVPASVLAYLDAYHTVRPEVGQPIYRLLSFRWAGLDPASGDPRIYVSDTINKSYTNTTYSSIKESDLTNSGRYNPPVTGSILNTCSWNGFSFSFNITYKLDYYFRRSSIRYEPLLATGVNAWDISNKDYAIRWLNPGDETKTNVPSFIYPLPPGNSIREAYYSQSDILVEKGDHIRLQYINLGYSFNKSLLKKIAIDNLQLYFYANNLGIIWRANKKGIDPDYPFIGYPPPKSFSFGVKANF